MPPANDAWREDLGNITRAIANECERVFQARQSNAQLPVTYVQDALEAINGLEIPDSPPREEVRRVLRVAFLDLLMTYKTKPSTEESKSYLHTLRQLLSQHALSEPDKGWIYDADLVQKVIELGQFWRLPPVSTMTGSRYRYVDIDYIQGAGATKGAFAFALALFSKANLVNNIDLILDTDNEIGGVYRLELQRL